MRLFEDILDDIEVVQKSTASQKLVDSIGTGSADYSKYISMHEMLKDYNFIITFSMDNAGFTRINTVRFIERVCDLFELNDDIDTFSVNHIHCYNCLSPVEQEQLPECIINSDATINSKEVNYGANIMEVCFYLKYNFKTSLKKKILFIKYISRLIDSLKLMNYQHSYVTFNNYKKDFVMKLERANLSFAVGNAKFNNATYIQRVLRYSNFLREFDMAFEEKDNKERLALIKKCESNVKTEL